MWAVVNGERRKWRAAVKRALGRATMGFHMGMGSRLMGYRC